jgi:hypothetical protein
MILSQDHQTVTNGESMLPVNCKFAELCADLAALGSGYKIEKIQQNINSLNCINFKFKYPTNSKMQNAANRKHNTV